MTASLHGVQRAAERYADARSRLKGRMESLQRTVDDATRAVLPAIQEAAAAAEDARAALETEIAHAPDAFVKPKTRTCSGIKVGFRAGRERVEWDDDKSLVSRIRSLFPAQFEGLVKTTEKPVSAALAALSAEQLMADAGRLEAGAE